MDVLCMLHLRNEMVYYSIISDRSPTIKMNKAGSKTQNIQISELINELAVVRRLHSEKFMKGISEGIGSRIEQYERMLKVIRKEEKDQRLTNEESYALFRGLYSAVQNEIRALMWEFRKERTDMEALFIRTKASGENASKQSIKCIEQIMLLNTKKSPEMMLNTGDNVLFEQRAEVKNFDISSLIVKALSILSENGYIKAKGDSGTSQLRRVVENVAKNYNVVPYHNFTHGYSVFLSFYLLSKMPQIDQYLNSFEQCFALIACLSHDVNHSTLSSIAAGKNTLFEVKTKSELAVNYGNFTVMEKMHLSKTMGILSRDQESSAFFESMSREEQHRARKVVTLAILATDMSRHYSYVDAIKMKRDTLEPASVQDRQLVIEVLAHASDLQNPSLDFQSYLYWANLVCLEFHDQTIQEQAHQVEVTDFMKFDSLPYFYKNQLSFANSIVIPLWESLESLFPVIAERDYTKQIKKNASLLSENMRRNSEALDKSTQKYLSLKLGKSK